MIFSSSIARDEQMRVRPGDDRLIAGRNIGEWVALGMKRANDKRWMEPTGGGVGSSSRQASRVGGRRESLVDMAFGSLPWIRRQSSTTGTGMNDPSGEDKLRKRRESLAAPKKSVFNFGTLIHLIYLLKFFCLNW